MAYCTVDDVNRNAVHIDIDPSSEPSSADVDDMITSVDTAIDQKLRAVGIDVPITDSALLRIVKQISINGVLARVYRAVEMDAERADLHQSLFDKDIADIMRTPAIMATSTRNTATPTGSDRGDPPFTRGGRNW
jgi:hypothetical protein